MVKFLSYEIGELSISARPSFHAMHTSLGIRGIRPLELWFEVFVPKEKIRLMREGFFFPDQKDPYKTRVKFFVTGIREGRGVLEVQGAFCHNDINNHQFMKSHELLQSFIARFVTESNRGTLQFAMYSDRVRALMAA